MNLRNKERLRWEAMCISAELAGISFGLVIGIGFGVWPIASIVMLGVCTGSFYSRLVHYSADGNLT